MATPRLFSRRARQSFAVLAWLLAALMAFPPGLLPTRAANLRGPATSDPLGRLTSGTLDEELSPGAGAVTPAWAMESAVDPQTYRLLPGDQLFLGLWGEAVRGYPLGVTPEGELIVARVGPIHVAGMTLREAEARVREALRETYPRARVSLNLTAPGRFRVSISGLVDRPGVYELTQGDRLSTALAVAGGIRGGGSFRRIQVSVEPRAARLSSGDPAGGTERESRWIDLAHWLLTGDVGANPFLVPGISIHVPGLGAGVRVRGPINGRSGVDLISAVPGRPGDRPDEEPNRIVEWLPGDTVGLTLDLLGGLSDRAAGEGTLYRNGEPPRELDLHAESGRRVPVQAGDVLDVDYGTRWVFVIGSVRAPGRYPYLPSLLARDYVHMAGGPSELGRLSGWSVETEDLPRRSVERTEAVPAGATIRVPERRTYTLTTLLAPITSAAALALSVVALSRRK